MDNMDTPGANEWFSRLGNSALSGIFLGGIVMPTGHLARNPNDRIFAGVCGGIARWLGWDSTAVRILYVLL